MKKFKKIVQFFLYPGDTMSIMDYFFPDYLEGKVVEKYHLENGNIGVIVEKDDNNRYHVEFNDKRQYPFDILGLFKTSFQNKTESIDKLVSRGHYIGISLNYTKSPFKQATEIHRVSPKPRNYYCMQR